MSIDSQPGRGWLVHPFTMISQRVGQGGVVHLHALLGDLQQQLLEHSRQIDQGTH